MPTNVRQNQTLILTEDLSKHFTDSKRGLIRAVDSVSIEAHPGQVFGLLGINGAGKTTMLRLLSTVLRPTSGRASVAGHDVVQQPEAVRANIGFLSASTALYGRLTGFETLEYFGNLYGLSGSKLKERIEFVTATLQLEEFGGSQCDKLSTGQKQRVSIARAILHDPPVLFLDEPTAGLDVVNAQTVMEFIEAFRLEGKTIVFSTHIMSEAERICDEVAVIHDGQIKARGTVAEIITWSGADNLERAFLSLVGYRREVVTA